MNTNTTIPGNELAPCPFCGGKAGADDKGMAGQDDWCRHYSVACADCCADCGWYDTEAEAIAAWNTRK